MLKTNFSLLNGAPLNWGVEFGRLIKTRGLKA